MYSQYLFLWQGFNLQGQVQQGELAAKNRQQAKQHLIAQGYYPIHLTRTIRLGKKCWRPTARIRVIRQLATLLQAGLPLVNSLQLIAGQHDSAPWRYLLNHLQQHVAQGIPLSEALANHPHAFPPIYRQLIATGELTGQLDRCCLQLADQQERLLHIRAKVRKALRYPTFVLCISLLVTLLMLLFVLPEFASIYQSFEAPLPWFTQLLLQISSGLQQSWHVLLLISGTLFAGYRRFRHISAYWQLRELHYLMQLPIFKHLLINSALSRIFRTLAMTQSAGITLLTSLHTAGESADNLCYAVALEEIRLQVIKGIALQDAIKEQPLFPALAQQLICVGEESGMLEEVLDKLATTYEQQTEEMAGQLSQILEPVLMLIVGGIVGALVIAMYLPIFQLGNIIG